MGRGRRPNLALEPTRALQTQRAFRQRKAEHLATLEESVAQLREENAKLRKLLHLEPRSPLTTDTGSMSRSASPSTSNSGKQVAIQPKQEGCANCASMQEANRQLALAASQVEAQMSHLQQSIKALRSVLMQHNIPIPSPLGSSTPMDEGRESKRQRMEQQVGMSGIQMTHSYFNAPSPAEQQQYGPVRRPTSSAAAAGQAWHTPSPSAILSAPTPPSASFSPRHSYAASPGAYPSASVLPEEQYRARHHPGQARQLHGMSSPARQVAHLPPSWVGSSRQQHQQQYHSTDYGERAMPTDYPPLPQMRSPHGITTSSSPAAYPHSPFEPAPVHSPRARQSPREPPGSSEGEYSRPTYTAVPPRNGSTPTQPPPVEKAQKCGPSSNGCGSGSAKNGKEGKASCCPPKQSAQEVEPQAQKEAAWDGPAPLGVSFDMRANGNGGGEKSGKVEGEDECCFGLVKCDAEGRIVI